ncbi:MAG: hypothetical protein ACNA71_06840 [Kiritimatiellia bacterium]
MKNDRKPIIDLINNVLNGQPPIEIDPDISPAEGRLANQLIKESYLDGAVAHNGKGLPAMIAILDVTIKGRRLCAELEEEINSARITTKIKKGTVFLLAGLCGVIGGIIGSIVTAIILRRMGLQ